MRFLLVLALATGGVAQGQQEAQEQYDMATPNIQSIMDWVLDEYPGLTIQTQNCRPIAGTNQWSQHSWGNAADIFVSPSIGDELKPRLQATFGPYIKTILWRVADHFDHIHVDTWPTGIGTPPCGGGSTRVEHKDGSRGTVFTDDIPEGGDDMPLTDAEIQKIAQATAERVWFHLIDDEVTGEKRGAAFHLRNARKDSLSAAVNSKKAASLISVTADEIADELAQRLED